MLWNIIVQTALSTGLSAGIITLISIVFKDNIANYFKGALKLHFDEKLETFKAEIRSKETEIEHQRSIQKQELTDIRSYLSEAKRVRSSILLNKRIEAAEAILDTLADIQKLSGAVDFAKLINIDVISKETRRDKLANVFSIINESFKIEENVAKINSTNEIKASLYLDDNSLRNFEAYKSIVLHSTLLIRTLSEGFDPNEYIQSDGLEEIITRQVPNAEEGFKKFGHSYAYHWADYFRKKTLENLRTSVSGADHEVQDATDALDLVVQASMTGADAKEKLKKAGLPEKFISTDEINAKSDT